MISGNIAAYPSVKLHSTFQWVFYFPVYLTVLALYGFLHWWAVNSINVNSPLLIIHLLSSYLQAFVFNEFLDAIADIKMLILVIVTNVAYCRKNKINRKYSAGFHFQIGYFELPLNTYKAIPNHNGQVITRNNGCVGHVTSRQTNKSHPRKTIRPYVRLDILRN